MPPPPGPAVAERALQSPAAAASLPDDAPAAGPVPTSPSRLHRLSSLLAARARPPTPLPPSFAPPAAPLVCSIGRTCAGACGSYHRPRRGEIRRRGGEIRRLRCRAPPLGGSGVPRRAEESGAPLRARSGTAQRCSHAARPASAPFMAEGVPRCLGGSWPEGAAHGKSPV